MTPESQALVGLVTPAYNQGRYLPATLDSVLAQTYPHLDYRVYDDGSSDDTPEVLDRYRDRVASCRQANQGQSRTLNQGWAETKAGILAYLSSDDLLAPGAVEAAVRALEAHPEVVAVYVDFLLIDDAGRPIRAVQTQAYSERTLIEDLVCFPGPGAFFRRDAFERSGGWDSSLRQVPDFEFWLRLSQHGPFLRVPEVLASYRIHEESASFRVVPAERSDEILQVVDRLWRERGASLRTAGHDEARSRSMAELMASRSHFSAGRYCRALMGVLRSWRIAPRRALQVLSWRILVGGLLRRPIYLLRTRLKKGA